MGLTLPFKGFSIHDLRAVCEDEACESDDNLYNTIFKCDNGNIQQIQFCLPACVSDPDRPGYDFCGGSLNGLHENENRNRVNIQIEI